MNLNQLELEEQAGLPRPRKLEIRKESKANNRRAELLSRCLTFLDYKNPKVFAIKVSHLDVETLEWILSISKAWKINGKALFWSKVKQSKPI